MLLNENTTIGEIINSKEYGEFADYIFTYMTPDHFDNTLSVYGFNKCGFLSGFKRIKELIDLKKNYFYNIYSDEEISREWDKRDAKYIYFPNKSGKKKPYVMVIPGGGFNRQWGFIEGLSIAARLNELDYPAFILFYRVKQEPLLPKPIEDMAAALKDIESKADTFNIETKNYMIGGFSAGATLAGLIGSDNYGYKSLGLKKPHGIFLAYSAVSFDEYFDVYNDKSQNKQIRNACGEFLRRIGGVEFTKESLHEFDLSKHFSDDYPSVYIVANEDDATVPVSNSYLLDKLCNTYNIKHITNIGRIGGHSFGLGNGLEVEGWLNKCVKWWENL